MTTTYPGTFRCVGHAGSVHDASVFSNSMLYNVRCNGKLFPTHLNRRLYGAISGTARMKNGAGKREVRIVYTEEIIPAAILFFPNRSQSFLSNTLILAVMNVIFAIAWRRLKNSGFQRGFNPWPHEGVGNLSLWSQNGGTLFLRYKFIILYYCSLNCKAL